MNATLEWRNEWLILVAGPWRLTVANIEPDEDGIVRAHIFGWIATEWGAITPDPGGDDHSAGEEPYERCDVPCRSPAEAIAVIRALLALRGVDCPPHPRHPSVPTPAAT